jgi:glycosyltransferase involved in cell wall biosynthesis
LLALGEDSSLLVRRKLGTDPIVVAFHPDAGLGAWLRRLGRQRAIDRDARRHLLVAFDPDRSVYARLRHRLQRRALDRDARRRRMNRPVGFELFSDDRSALGPELVRRLPATDIVTLNWIAGFVDCGSLFGGLPPGRRVVWRLPDMNAFTGGCHYDAGCGRYVDSCGNCPQLAARGSEDLSRQIWRRKQETYGRLSSGQLQLVALSSWQACEVRRSSLLSRFPLTVIPCGVDVQTFIPTPRNVARQSLDLPADSVIMLMAADILERPTKGANLLSAALGLLGAGERPVVLTVGQGKPALPAEFEHVHWGSVNDDRLLARLYSAADMLVFPSLQEAFGQTVIEALACGLPVVGFDTGGVRDAVSSGITGFVAEAKTARLWRALSRRPLPTWTGCGRCRRPVAKLRRPGSRWRSLRGGIRRCTKGFWASPRERSRSRRLIEFCVKRSR